MGNSEKANTAAVSILRNQKEEKSLIQYISSRRFQELLSLLRQSKVLPGLTAGGGHFSPYRDY